MADYKAMYYKLFNKITDVICDLQEIQQLCEQMYLDGEEEKLKLFSLAEKEDYDSEEKSD